MYLFSFLINKIARLKSIKQSEASVQAAVESCAVSVGQSSREENAYKRGQNVARGLLVFDGRDG